MRRADPHTLVGAGAATSARAAFPTRRQTPLAPQVAGGTACITRPPGEQGFQTERGDVRSTWVPRQVRQTHPDAASCCCCAAPPPAAACAASSSALAPSTSNSCAPVKPSASAHAAIPFLSTGAALMLQLGALHERISCASQVSGVECRAWAGRTVEAQSELNVREYEKSMHACMMMATPACTRRPARSMPEPGGVKPPAPPAPCSPSSPCMPPFSASPPGTPCAGLAASSAEGARYLEGPGCSSAG